MPWSDGLHIRPSDLESFNTRAEIFIDVMKNALKLIPKESPCVVDLGCGHCGFTRITKEFFKLQVTPMDARRERIPAWADNFVQQDVRDVDLTPYDLVLCLGLFYHMTLNDQIDLVKKFKDKVVILDTHYKQATQKSITELGSDNIEYTGSYYTEGEGLLASFKNRKSFWAEEQDLIKLIGKNHDITKWLPEHAEKRTFFLLSPKAPNTPI